MPFHVLHAVSLETGNHEYGIETALPRERVGQAEQPVAADQIDLVQREDRSAAALPQSAEDAAGVLVDAARGVDQQQSFVSIRGTRPCRRHHRPVEPAPRRKDAGRIHIDDLRRALDCDAEQPVARRLRLRCDDRQLMADEPVEQGRLAGIRRPDQRDIAATRRRRLGFGHRVRRRAVWPSRQPRHGSRTRRPGAIWRGGSSRRGSRCANDSR